MQDARKHRNILARFILLDFCELRAFSGTGVRLIKTLPSETPWLPAILQTPLIPKSLLRQNLFPS